LVWEGKGDVMNNLNSVLLEGNLVRDPLYKTTPGGTVVCSFSVACNRSYKHEGEIEKEVSFFDVEAWAKLAETCRNFGHKGRGVRVVGRLKQTRWTDQEGKNHARVIVVAEHVEFRPELKPVQLAIGFTETEKAEAEAEAV
jgi:single-strand DNA-binding protein